MYLHPVLCAAIVIQSSSVQNYTLCIHIDGYIIIALCSFLFNQIREKKRATNK